MVISHLQDRAKIQTRRRPQSRIARKAAAAQSSDGSDDLFSPTSPTATSPFSSGAPSLSSPSSPPRVPLPTDDLLETSKGRPKADLFGNEDLFSSDLPKSSAKSVIRTNDTDTNKSSSGDMFSDNLFSGTSAKKTAKTDDFDDLFAGPGSKVKNKSDVIKPDESDIFNSVPKKSDTKTDQKPSQTKADEDIFAVKTTPKSKPAAVSEEDDLFSSSILSNKTSDKKSSTKTLAAEDSLADKKIEENGLPTNEVGKGVKGPGIEDDIFADSSLNKKKGEL